MHCWCGKCNWRLAAEAYRVVHEEDREGVACGPGHPDASDQVTGENLVGTRIRLKVAVPNNDKLCWRVGVISSFHPFEGGQEKEGGGSDSSSVSATVNIILKRIFRNPASSSGQEPDEPDGLGATRLQGNIGGYVSIDFEDKVVGEA